MDPTKLVVRSLVDLGELENMPSDEAIYSQSCGAVRTLADLGLIDEQKALKALSAKLYVDYVDLDRLPEGKRLEPQHFEELNREVLARYKLFPLWKEKESYVVATANPFDMEGINLLEFALGKRVQIVLAEESKIQSSLTEYFPDDISQFDILSDLESEDYVEILGKNSATESDDINASEIDAPPIVRLANKIIADAYDKRASDIHIEPGQDKIEIRFRIDGVMHNFLEIPKRLQPYLLSRIKLIAGMDIAEKRKPQDGRLRVRVNQVPIDMRASSVPTAFGEKMVLRILRSDAAKVTFSELGVSPPIEKKLNSALDKRGKLFLVTGPTGSGKTTMLYTFLNYLRDGKTNIQTVEDPIEYRVPGISQIQVNNATGVTFASALRSVLRQDPDIILIGEIRDEETACIALQAAQTGHLVISTLHTNDAPSAVTRLMNLGVDPFLLGSSLEGVLAQRLIRKTCVECQRPLTDMQLAKYGAYIEHYSIDPATLYAGTGCEECHYSGYMGRTGLYSYLQVDGRIEECIYRSAPTSEIVHTALQRDYTDLHFAAIEAVKSGITTFDEVKAYLVLPEITEVAHVASQLKEVQAVEEVHEQEEEQVQEEEQEPARNDGIEKTKVLLVEDDEDTRSVLSLLLQREMYEVIEAENGAEGLQKVYEHNPGVVICDMMMPVMDGKEFLKKMHSRKETKSIPVVFLTAIDSEENELELLELGAQDFVSKTTSSSIMLTRIRNILERQ